MSKFNTLFQQYKTKLISESISSERIKQLLTGHTDERNDKKIEDVRYDAERILSNITSIIRKNEGYNSPALSLDELKTIDFIDNKIKSKTVISRYDFALEFLDKIKNDITPETKELILQKLAELREFWSTSMLDFSPETKKARWMTRILSAIDAGTITDDDIEIFTKDNFKNFNKKVRSSYSYVLAVKNNKPIAIAHFDEDGRINFIEKASDYRFYRDNPKLIDVLDTADELICINDKFRSERNKKILERDKTREYGKLDQMSTDERLAYEKDKARSRLANKQYELKTSRKETELQNKLSIEIERAKSVGQQARELLRNEDIFSSDSPIATEFLKFISVFRTAKEELPKIRYWDERSTNQLAEKLAYATNTLEEKLNDLEEE